LLTALCIGALCTGASAQPLEAKPSCKPKSRSPSSSKRRTQPPTALSCATPEFPDIRSVPADLFPPNVTVGAKPAAGLRVHESLPGFGAMYHALYLPTDFVQGGSSLLPLYVEWGGNGPWSSPAGDYSCGSPDCNNLGYGLSGGVGAIWLQLPFADLEGQAIQTWWWGCPTPVAPDGHCFGFFNTTATLAYTKAAVAHVLAAYGGDPSRVILMGFSRGALAVNYLGLADDEMASLWRGTVPYAHYDGRPADQGVPYPDHDPASAIVRLRRMGSKPTFIVEEMMGSNGTSQWIETTGVPLNATYHSTGFCNHNDAWTLRNSKARTVLREWLAAVLA
jgi:hypothetical protein